MYACAAILSFCSVCSSGGQAAADWPTWRYDAARSAASPHSLPAELHLKWLLHYPPLKPAWPDQDRMQFDAAYLPVVSGKTMFIGSSHNDSLTAIDTDTGKRRWRCYTDGPVRFAPIAWKDRVFFASDDGHLYCLKASDGVLLWKFNGKPSERKVLGNERLISPWPARGGPVLAGDAIYFAAGIWPFEGVFIYALDAATGRVIWTNDSTGAIYMNQPHDSPAFAAVAPQGALAVAGDRLIVPGGRSVPAVFELHTGKFLYYHLAANGKRGSHRVVATDSFFFNSGTVFDLADGSRHNVTLPEPISAPEALYTSDGHNIRALNVPGATIEPTKEKRPRGCSPWRTTELWSLKTEGKLQIKAGSRLYINDGPLLKAVDLPGNNGKAKVSWQTMIAGTPANMLAADGKLIVVTLEGTIYCFGEKPATARMPGWHVQAELGRGANTANRSRLTVPRSGRNQWAATAGAILKQTGVTEGYCVALGVGSGGLVEEIARQSKLHVIAIDPDAKKVTTVRRRLDALGLYGHRVAVYVGDPLGFRLSPYLASLIVSEDPAAAGRPATAAFVREVHRVLRPYGGVACLPMSKDRHEAFAASIARANFPNAEVKRAGGFTLLTRAGPLPGSADWTHQYADAANSVVSKDKLVQAPLGLLWFGGSSNEKILPRHGHGPSPQVAGGRLFIEGPDIIRAKDVYTGRVLWEADLEGIGTYYDYTSHQPGANSLGSNYVSLADGIYVAHGDVGLRLAPATGRKLAEFRLPPADGETARPKWGYIGVWEDILLAGAQPLRFWAPDFTVDEFKKWKDGDLARLANSIKALKNFRYVQKKKGQNDRHFIAVNFNRLLTRDDITVHISDAVNAMAARLGGQAGNKSIAGLRKRIADHIKARRGPLAHDIKLTELNRNLLRCYYSALPKIPKRPKIGGKGLDYTASKRLVAMNRHTGEVLWTYTARHSLRHNAIVMGAGKVFCIDRLPAAAAGRIKRRGGDPDAGARVIAIDARTGREVWSTGRNVFGTWLGYSEKHDLLLQAGRSSRDMVADEAGERMIVCRGVDGGVLWDKSVKYSGPCMLHNETIITQGFALDLLSGETRMRKHPLSGTEVPWTFVRNYGCDTAVASEHLLTFRSAAAGYFDLKADGGTGTFGGFRSSCTSNLIAANGVLSAPDYTRTCVCSYQNQCSVALVHTPETPTWTFNRIKWPEERVQQIGINLGAPGDREADNGTLWLEYPATGGPSPKLPIAVSPANTKTFRLHPWRITGNLNWVAASGMKGLSSFVITIDRDPATKHLCTVRLHFAEPDRVGGGERVFSVSLQGKQVLKDFDIVRAAGRLNRRAVVREFKGVEIAADLKVSMIPSKGTALLCGIEIVSEQAVTGKQ